MAVACHFVLVTEAMLAHAVVVDDSLHHQLDEHEELSTEDLAIHDEVCVLLQDFLHEAIVYELLNLSVVHVVDLRLGLVVAQFPDLFLVLAFVHEHVCIFAIVSGRISCIRCHFVIL